MCKGLQKQGSAEARGWQAPASFAAMGSSSSSACREQHANGASGMQERAVARMERRGVGMALLVLVRAVLSVLQLLFMSNDLRRHLLGLLLGRKELCLCLCLLLIFALALQAFAAAG